MKAEIVDVVMRHLRLTHTPQLDIGGLRNIVRSFNENTPFENFDVLSGQTPSLDLQRILEKICIQRRGGWCFELNTLMGGFLREMGFYVSPAMARVTLNRPTPGPNAHLFNVVEIDRFKWLVDVGFGGPGPLAPLLIGGQENSLDRDVCARVEQVESGKFILSRRMQGRWTSIYQFTLEDVLPVDVTMANIFLSTWKMSPFANMAFCVRNDSDITLQLDWKSIVTRNRDWEIVERQPIPSYKEFLCALTEKFGINLPADVGTHVWQLISQRDGSNELK